MEISYRRFAGADVEALVGFLTGEPWPFHSTGSLDPEVVRRRVADGYYDSPSVRTFWIETDGARVGLVQVQDLDDGTPLFDLRIRHADRGRGIGERAVGWLTTYLFTELPEILRVEGTTRQDNVAMRTVFRRCGYVKEAHYRDGWPSADGGVHDAVGYAILRRDWLAGMVTPVDWADE